MRRPYRSFQAARLGVLYNPGSGANRRSPGRLQAVRDAQPELAWCEVAQPSALAAGLSALARRGVDVLAISGGDGTVQAALSVLYGGRSPFQRPPALAVLRSGTTNMTAGDVGVPGPPARALARLLDAVARGVPLGAVARPVLRVDAGPGQAPVCGMYLGAAAIVQGVEYCTHRLHRVGLRGQIGPGLTLARFAWAMARGDRAIASPARVEVALDGAAPWALDAWIVQVTTLERLFLGLRPFWDTAAAPLHFTCVRAQPRAWLRSLPGLLRGHPGSRLTPGNGYESRNVDTLALALAPDGRYIVDGEVFTSAAGRALRIATAGMAEFVRPP